MAEHFKDTSNQLNFFFYGGNKNCSVVCIETNPKRDRPAANGGQKTRG
jgi:hypothetical protein